LLKTEKEICDLIETGFEFVTGFSGRKDLQETKIPKIIYTKKTLYYLLIMVQEVGFETPTLQIVSPAVPFFYG
jgi:hypothetical protein